MFLPTECIYSPEWVYMFLYPPSLCSYRPKGGGPRCDSEAFLPPFREGGRARPAARRVASGIPALPSL
jgi:hypothetical protein